jgi:hypothetical protein
MFAKAMAHIFWKLALVTLYLELRFSLPKIEETKKTQQILYIAS